MKINDFLLVDYCNDISRFQVLDIEKEHLLIKAAKKGCQKSKNKLIESNLRFVIKVALGYQNNVIPLVDLINAGNIGLMKAVDRFNLEENHVKLITYAVWWIKQAIKQEINEQSKIVHIPINKLIKKSKMKTVIDRFEQINGKKALTDDIWHEMMKDSSISKDEIDELLGIDLQTNQQLLDDIQSDEQTDKKALSSSLQQIIKSELAGLKKNQQIVIKLYFGIDTTHQFTLEEIGDILNITRERVRQIKAAGMRKLKKSYKLSQIIGDVL